METTNIHVHYPLNGDSVVLCTDQDWDAEIEPIERSETCATFQIVTDCTFLYFKPVLKKAGERRFSIGSNYLAVPGPRDRHDVYPHFFEAPHGEISEVEVWDNGRRQHLVRVYTPPGYAENTLCRYPVVYMQDGHNLFFPEEAFTGQTWELERTLELLDQMNAIDNLIVVGVYPRDRMRDYTFPGYQDYGSFLVKELKPAIDTRYRTKTAPDNTAVIGSSLGGVVSLYLGWQFPETFGKVASLSSTFTFKDDLMRRITEEDKRPLKIYLDSGWPGDNFEVTRVMFDLLQRQGYEVGRELLYFAFPEHSHSEADWANRLHIPFQFLFHHYAEEFLERNRRMRTAV